MSRLRVKALEASRRNLQFLWLFSIGLMIIYTKWDVVSSQVPVWQKCGVFAMIIPSQAGVRVSVGELAYSRENVLTRS